MEHLKYPIGKFEYGKNYSMEDNVKHISEIENLPNELTDLINNFTADLLEKSYRPEGWTARQIVHHIADSHLNAYIRTKWSLT
jgi:hypothetical protein